MRGKDGRKSSEDHGTLHATAGTLAFTLDEIDHLLVLNRGVKWSDSHFKWIPLTVVQFFLFLFVCLFVLWYNFKGELGAEGGRDKEMTFSNS